MNYILDLSWKTPEELTALVDALRPYVYKELERMRLEKSCGNPEPIGKPGDGSSPHCSIIDEYHEHQTDEALATMEKGTGNCQGIIDSSNG